MDFGSIANLMSKKTAVPSEYGLLEVVPEAGQTINQARSLNLDNTRKTTNQKLLTPSPNNLTKFDDPELGLEIDYLIEAMNNNYQLIVRQIHTSIPNLIRSLTRIKPLERMESPPETFKSIKM